MSLYYVCECTMDWSTGVHSGSPMYLLAPRFPSGWCRYTFNLPPSLTHTYAHSFLISLRVLQPISCSLRKGIWNELPQHPKERERERGRCGEAEREGWWVLSEWETIRAFQAAQWQLRRISSEERKSEGGRQTESPARERHLGRGAAAATSLSLLYLDDLPLCCCCFNQSLLLKPPGLLLLWLLLAD